MVGVVAEFQGTLEFWNYAIVDPATGQIESRVPISGITSFTHGAGALDGAENHVWTGADNGQRRLYMVTLEGNYFIGPVQQQRAGLAIADIQGFEITWRFEVYLPVVIR